MLNYFAGFEKGPLHYGLSGLHICKGHFWWTSYRGRVLLVSWFLGFLVSWFLSLLVLDFLFCWFLGVSVSCSFCLLVFDSLVCLFLVVFFLLSKFQSFKDLPDVHCMFFDRY